MLKMWKLRIKSWEEKVYNYGCTFDNGCIHGKESKYFSYTDIINTGIEIIICFNEITLTCIEINASYIKIKASCIDI